MWFMFTNHITKPRLVQLSSALPFCDWYRTCYNDKGYDSILFVEPARPSGIGHRLHRADRQLRCAFAAPERILYRVCCMHVTELARLGGFAGHTSCLAGESPVERVCCNKLWGLPRRTAMLADRLMRGWMSNLSALCRGKKLALKQGLSGSYTRWSLYAQASLAIHVAVELFVFLDSVAGQ